MSRLLQVILFFTLSFYSQATFALIGITVSGNTNTIPALASSYVSLSSAINALNSVTSITGPVTFNMNAGTSESTTSQYLLTQSGSTLFPITFQKVGTGLNPKLTRTDAGANATTATGGFGDGVLRVDGCDNLFFNGLDIAASNQGIEYGYYIHKPNSSNGSQVLSIRNSTITMTKGTSAFVIGIYIDNGQTALSSSDGLTISAASGRHINITIAGNTIQNVHRGIYCYGHYGTYLVPTHVDRDFIIGESGAGNIIQNFGGGVVAHAAGITTRYIADAHISYNTIQNAAGGGIAHTSTLAGIELLNGNGHCSAYHNTINLNNTSGEVDWVYLYSFGFSQTFPTKSFQAHHNTLSGSIGTGSSYFFAYSVIADGSNLSTRNNITNGTITKTGSGTLYGYYITAGSNASEVFSNNNFSNINVAGGFQGTYIDAESDGYYYVDSNTISNINNTGTSLIYGLFIRNAGNGYCRDNKIFGLSGAGSITGIYTYNYNNISNYEIYRNKIYNLNTSSATSTANTIGLYLYSSNYGGKIKVYNNLIGHLSAPASTNIRGVMGMYLYQSSTLDSIQYDLAHNSIYLNATSSATNFGVNGIYHHTFSVSDACNVLLRNNLIINTGTPKGSGLCAAYVRNETSTNQLNPRSNHNLYYCGIPSANRVIHSNGTANYSTLNDYQNYLLTAQPTAERNSYTENVLIQSLNGAQNNYLQFDTTIASSCESGGVKISAPKDDFSGTIRAEQIGYLGNGYSADIGAWELNGIAHSECSGVPATSNSIISNNNPCSDSIFSVYLNTFYPAGTKFQWQYSNIDSSTGFTNIVDAIDAHLIHKTTIDTWYRCEITCAISNQSIFSSVSKTTPTPLHGTYTISNSGGDFSSFDAAIAALHCRSTSAPVVFEVSDGQIFNEINNLTIRYTGIHNVTFRKQGNGVNPIIRRSGTGLATNYILELSGADNITFDGIDFEQSGTASSSWVEYGIHLVNPSSDNGCHYNTFKNGTITLTTASGNTIGVYMHTGSASPTSLSGTHSYNRFEHMTVQQCAKGYSFDNASTILNQGNVICGGSGQYGIITAIGNPTVSASNYGIYAEGQSGLIIDSIDMYGITSGSFCYGIYVDGGDTIYNQISNCHIHFNTSSSSFRAISTLEAGKMKIFNNEINEIWTTSTTSASIVGIRISSNDSMQIHNNKIYNLSGSLLTTGYVNGILFQDSGKYNFYNNMISDLRAGASNYYPAAVSAIELNFTNPGGFLNCYHNSIYLNDIATNASYRSACISVQDTTMLLDLRNNIFINQCNVTNGSFATAIFNRYSPPDIFSNTCNNNLWYSGLPDSKHLIYYGVEGFTSIYAQTLAQYKALSIISPAEITSVSSSVVFVPSLQGDLRPDATVAGLVEGRGQYVSSIPFDYDYETRNNINPDLGADEGNFIAIANADCPSLTIPLNGQTGFCPYESISLNWTMPPSGKTPLSYDVYLGNNINPPFLANTSNLFYPLSMLTGNATYYWKVVAKYANGDAANCGLSSFTTADASIYAVTNGVRCGPGVVNLSVNGGGTIQWYNSLTSNTVLQTGSSYSPNISANTNFYVSSTNGYGVYGANVGKLNLGTSSTSSTSTTEYLIFNALTNIVIDSVVVYPSAAGNVVLQLRNNAGSTLNTFTMAVSAAQIGLAVSVPVNWVVSAGNGYRIYKPSTSVALLRNTTGATYPYTLAGKVSITGNSVSTAYYSWAYNWTVRAACESPRQLVTATLSNNLSSKTTVNACNSYTWNISGLTYTSGGTYVHVTNLPNSCVQTDSLVLSLGVSGNNPIQNVTACGSYIWPVNGVSYTSSGVYVATFNNVNGCDSSWQLNLTLQSCISTLNLKFLLQGYYDANGIMRPVLMNQGIGVDTSLVDFVTVELHDATTYEVVSSSIVLLNTDGSCVVNFAITPGNYFIAVKHRNTIETWSNVAIPLGASPISYDFTTAANKAYGNNMKQVDIGYWALYAGDINNEGNVDMIDIAGFEADLSNVLFGYYASDVNGDGNVDLLDAPIFENNLSDFVFTIHP